ncbi:MAG: hypothetical protein ACLTNY_10325, partial [Blautia massiliensis (ex Durand et al. 2017)]
RSKSWGSKYKGPRQTFQFEKSAKCIESIIEKLVNCNEIPTGPLALVRIARAPHFFIIEIG